MEHVEKNGKVYKDYNDNDKEGHPVSCNLTTMNTETISVAYQPPSSASSDPVQPAPAQSTEPPPTTTVPGGDTGAAAAGATGTGNPPTTASQPSGPPPFDCKFDGTSSHDCKVFKNEGCMKAKLSQYCQFKPPTCTADRCEQDLRSDEGDPNTDDNSNINVAYNAAKKAVEHFYDLANSRRGARCIFTVSDKDPEKAIKEFQLYTRMKAKVISLEKKRQETDCSQATTPVKKAGRAKE